METIIIDGRKRYMAAEPFNYYLETLDDPPELSSPHTACWRGYFGRWKIRVNKLFMTGLEAYVDIGGKTEEVGLDYFFPDQKQVFAEWFTGEIRVPMGKEIQYVHMGYESLYERDLLIHVKDGNIVSMIEIDNL